MIPAERALSWVHSRWSDLLRRLTGRYYDPSMDSMMGVLVFGSLVILDSLRRGSDHVDTGLLVVGVTALVTGFVYYRQEQRWRA